MGGVCVNPVPRVGRAWWLYAYLIFLPLPGVIFGQECSLSATETLEIGPTKSKLLEIHVRNNIQVMWFNYIYYI